MKYLFVQGSMTDKGGMAMIQGAINGIRRLDPSADFAACLSKDHFEFHRDIEHFVRMIDGIRWADRVLDVGGLFHESYEREQQVAIARKFDKLYIWMSQSFPVGLKSARLFPGTIPIARGELSAKKVEELTGRQPIVAADLSFLVEPRMWEGGIYERGFTTHRKRPPVGWEKYFPQDWTRAVQLIWKPETTHIWEPLLGIDTIIGTVEELFGLVASLKAMYSSRYQAACAAILAGIPLMLLTANVNAAKYSDLKCMRKMGKAALVASAMRSCEVAVFTKGEVWN